MGLRLVLQSRPLCSAIYAISVRRLGNLPAASFRFHLTVDTLAVRLTLPITKRVVYFHHQAFAHAGRTTKTYAWSVGTHAYVFVLSPPNETPTKLSLLEAKFDIHESAGSGSGVLIRMLRLTVIGYGSGHACAIGSGRHGIISASGCAQRA